MGHFEGRGDTQVYVGDDDKVYATPAEEKVLAENVDAFFGDNGKAPKSPPKPPEKPKKVKARKKYSQRKLRKDRFEMVNCTICGKAKKKGAGMTKHMSMMHKEV